MASSRIGELVVNLKANTATFLSDMDKSRTKATAVGVALGSIAAGVAESFARMAKDAAAAIPRLIKSSIDLGDELAKTAQRTGTTVESLSALRYAASLSDIDFGQLSTAIGRLSRNLSDVQRGTGEAKKAFADLGISAVGSDGQLRGVEAVIGDVAERFSKMEDGTKKTALALEIFGRAGQSMIPFLNEGREGLTAATEEARRLGIVMSTETAKASEEFNDNLTRLKSSVEGAGMAMASALLPWLVKVTDATVNWVKAFRSLPDAFREELDRIVQIYDQANRKFEQIFGGLGNFTNQARGFRGAGATESFAEPTQKPFEPPPIDDKAFKAFQSKISKYLQPVEPLQPWNPIPATLAFDNASEYVRRWQENIKAMIAQLEAEMNDFHFEQLAGPMRDYWDQLNAGIDLTVKNVKDLTPGVERVQSAFEQLSHTINQSFEDALIQAQGFRNILAGLLQDIARTILRMTVTGPGGIIGGLTAKLAGVVAGAFGGAASAGPIYGPPIPANLPYVGAFATGGMVPATGMALVHAGEQIIPAGRGGGATINITVNGDPDRRTIRALAQTVKAAYKDAVVQSQAVARDSRLRNP